MIIIRIDVFSAPTAGLHFTEDILHQLSQQGVKNTRVELHVSAGTFRPVTAAFIAEHNMHYEVSLLKKN